MELDRRMAYKIAQALEHARNRRSDVDVLELAAQKGPPTDDTTAEQQYDLVPIPRPNPIRDPDRFKYTGEIAKMAKERGAPPHEQLSYNMAPGTLSRLAGLQTAYGRPLEIDAAFNIGNHKATGAHPQGKAFDLNVYPATDTERARVIELATQMGFLGTGSYQDPDDDQKGRKDPRIHVDVMRPHRDWGHDTTSATTPIWHKKAIARGLAAGEPDIEALAAKADQKYPILRRPRQRPLQEE